MNPNEARELVRRALAEPAKNWQQLQPLTDDEREVANIKTVPAHHTVIGQTEQMSQFLAWPAADLPPLNRAANTTANATGWVVGPVNMSLFTRVLGKLMTGAGTSGSNTTVQFLCGNTTNSLQAVTGAAWTWTTVTNGPVINIGSTANSATIEMRADQMPTKTNYVLLLVNNQCAQLFAAELIASGATYSPASQYNNTSALAQSIM